MPLSLPETKYKSRKNNLWNITLMKAADNSLDKDWDEERIILKELGNDFLMNYLEKEKWTDIGDINELAKRREKFLADDFRKLGIFETD